MDRIEQLKIFIQVVDSGNFTKAALVLNKPRSTVSTVIQELENKLGTSLFHRTTRSMSPTDDGLQYFELARSLVDQFDAAETLFLNNPVKVKGRIRVDIPSRIARRIVIPALPDFLIQYPDLEIEFGASDKYTDLVSDGVDCVLRVGPLTDSELICKKLGDLSLCNCASPNYLVLNGTPIELADLQKHKVVNYCSSVAASSAGWEYCVDGEIRKIIMGSNIAVYNAEAYIAAALAGLGIIQVPRFDVVDLIESGALIEVMSDYRPLPLQLSLLYPSRKNLTPRVKIFQDWLCQLVSQKCLNSDEL
ncbi:LysR family transcriptional regulator [Pseudoalteromonas tunicata]|jgi:DNA-binding transcriptional LysR family regulator|uniref:Transcriptional regulator n=1 Tax=Pseudoalteromonas tunicata D2 TaxID=87626 RepID=A4C723_9GAMM|nr:LysR family transcriptional regulator [Pseudoalteromonas tunicata]ATC95748.1 hypothetical protein PTUN_a3411 [Pseudoalteromonas tunicata]AXT31301.1 LysR family transcriptional regulator [Pseudoalteromonas tunicata]EAR29777.1 Transcriptional regulator [Pseudoalteromonas tunicata D2]MDP4983824.1 LysR family transcriptional regulator [Pseudoalteromonas tunicata]MDP5214014.1 LysR family transcriptional regulator [Pseudoalteromonas tunicata]